MLLFLFPSMQLTFLGTSCMVPTKERNLPGVFLTYNNIGILFDCGENIQRQMNIAGIKRTKVDIILITHFHADHMSGLIGLLQTISNEDNEKKIMLFGPEGTKQHMACLFKSCKFPRINITIKELKPKGVEKFFETENFFLSCSKLDHSIPCLGYSFEEKEKIKISLEKAKKYGLKQGPILGKIKQGKTIIFKGKKIKPEDITYKVKGKKITYIVDTLPCKNAIELAKDSDLLISEAVYTSSLEEKAREYKHLTAKQAAFIANNANVKKLILTHFSQRYKSTKEIEEDAKTYFNNVVCSYDFMKIKL